MIRECESDRREPRLDRRAALKVAGGALLAAAVPKNSPAANTTRSASIPHDQYARYDALGLAELVREKEVKPEELLEAAIARAEAVNPKINGNRSRRFSEEEDYHRGRGGHREESQLVSTAFVDCRGTMKCKEHGTVKSWRAAKKAEAALANGREVILAGIASGRDRFVCKSRLPSRSIDSTGGPSCRESLA